MRLIASLDLRSPIQPFEILGERAQRGVAVLARAAAPEMPRRAASRRRTPRPRTRDDSSSAACADQRLPARGRHLDEHRLEQPLALQPAARQPLGDALEQDALVRDVLIDDRDALFVHRDDEGVAELPERHQRLAMPCRLSMRRSSLVGANPLRSSVRTRFAGRCEPAPRVGAPAPTVQRLGNTAGYAVGSGSVDGCGSPDPWRDELQLRRRAATERVAKRTAHQLVDERLVAEPHLRLRRMHVDVHRVGRHLDEEMHLRAALLDRRRRCRRR